MTSAPPKVFISYSHDTVAHQARVLDLADRLRADGINAEIDQYNDSPSEGWPRWCERQIEAADVVLMVCTETYHRRVKDEEEPGTGRGVVWEAAIIRQLLYDAGAVSNKFVPVLFSDASPEQIPRPIKGWTYYVVDTEDGYEGLYRQVTKQPGVVKPALGKRKVLEPKEPRPEAAAAARSAEQAATSLLAKPTSAGTAHEADPLRLEMEGENGMPDDDSHPADKTLSDRVLYIPLPRSSKQCFLAFPFPETRRLTAAQADVADAIVIALKAEDMLCTRLDLKSRENHFFDDIVKNILEADAVIAVLNDPINRGANPNVMYEVGLAHALAKPVIIVVDKPGSLPGNLVAKNCVPYVIDRTFQKDRFVHEIRDRLRNAIKKARESPVHPLWTQAITRPSTRLLANCLDFGGPIYDAFQRIFGWIDPLSQSSLEMSVNVETASATFERDYRNYLAYYRSAATAPITEAYPERRKSADDDIRLLAGHIPPLVRDYHKLSGYHHNLCNGIDRFAQFHKDTEAMTNSIFAQARSLSPDRRPEVKLYASVKLLKTQCDSVLADAVSYIKEVASALCAMTEDVHHV